MTNEPLMISTSALRDVLGERVRQLTKEGYTIAHDDEHDEGELSAAAACYVIESYKFSRNLEPMVFDSDFLWPWDRLNWKPKDQRSNLVRAGALILAEIERLDRIKEKS